MDEMAALGNQKLLNQQLVLAWLHSNIKFSGGDEV
jgi:carboxylesterase type B